MDSKDKRGDWVTGRVAVDPYLKGMILLIVLIIV